MRIPSPTVKETVITTPQIPGLELHLPPQTVITDHDGKVVREISITPIPVDQPPFPLPSGVQVPIYFTIQPGGAYVAVHAYGNARKGAWLVYPNYTNRPVGTEHQFWHYDPEEKGWHVYGMGVVATGGRQVVPNARRRAVRVHWRDDQRRAEPLAMMADNGRHGRRSRRSLDRSLRDEQDRPGRSGRDAARRVTAPTGLGDSGSRPFGIGMTHPMRCSCGRRISIRRPI